MRTALALVLLLTPLAARALTPIALSHQGHLVDASDAPVTAFAQSFGFSLWSLPIGGVQQWPASGESACVADVKAGYYAIVLEGASAGCGAGLTAELLASAGEHWLRVSVGSVVLEPRQRVVLTAAAALANGLTTTLPVAAGGSGGTTADEARANLVAAKSGTNADITSLTGLTTPLPVAAGGTGAGTAAAARTSLAAAKSGANADITSLTGLTTPLAIAAGGTGVATLASNAVVLGRGGAALATVSGTGTAGHVLTSQGSGADPAWAAPSTQAGSVVGDIRYSLLTEAQLQAQAGTGWILANGRSVAGSAYATLTGSGTVPDLRGLFLRGRNNGRADGKENPDGDLAVGTYQADGFKGHYHLDGYDDTALSGKFGKEDGGGHAGRYPHSDTASAGGNSSSRSSTAGGNETRGRNATVNIFIRID